MASAISECSITGRGGGYVFPFSYMTHHIDIVFNEYIAVHGGAFSNIVRKKTEWTDSNDCLWYWTCNNDASLFGMSGSFGDVFYGNETIMSQ